MALSGLMAHVDTDKMTREQVAMVETPPAQGARHLPVAHIDVVDALTKGLARRGYRITEEEFAVGNENTITLPSGERTKWPNCSIFGVMHIENPYIVRPENAETGLSIGFRSNNTRKLPVQIVAGQRVFVCDNLMIDGDFQVLRKKHTLNLNIIDEIDDALNKMFHSQVGKLEDHIQALKASSLSDTQARAAMFRLFDKYTDAEGVLRGAPLPLRHLQKVSQWYFNPEDQHTDVTPRSLWGVHNAVTRVLKDEPINRRLEFTQGVTKALLLEAA